MDGDPAVEPEIDGFTRILPLPYRVAIIIVLGTLLAHSIGTLTFPALLRPPPFSHYHDSKLRHQYFTQLTPNPQESGPGASTSTT